MQDDLSLLNTEELRNKISKLYRESWIFFTLKISVPFVLIGLSFLYSYMLFHNEPTDERLSLDKELLDRKKSYFYFFAGLSFFPFGILGYRELHEKQIAADIKLGDYQGELSRRRMVGNFNV